MATFQRVLNLYGRSLEDDLIQCNCDLHPWQISIDGERWTGKMRLIGFIDVVFIISYSQNSCFQRGLIIYKNPKDTEQVLSDAKLPLENFKLKGKSTSSEDATAAAKKGEIPPNTYFKSSRTAMAYTLTGVGHEVGLRSRYTKDEVRTFNIVIRKPQESALKAEIKRAFHQHDTVDLMNDVIKLGFMSYADFLGQGAGYMGESGVLKSFTGGMKAQSGQSAMLSGGNL